MANDHVIPFAHVHIGDKLFSSMKIVVKTDATIQT
jgi:hypothetical protein